MKKRILAFMVCVCLMAAVFLVPSVTALADGGGSWSDESNRDTAWTDGAISTPQQLAQFAYLVNSGSYNGNGEIWLVSDIDLAGNEWVPIGYRDNDNFYSGLFNGNGFTVANMSITNFTKDYNEVGAYGLFGIVGGTVQYVNVTGDIICREFSQYYYSGGIAGYSYYGKIIGCTSAVNMSFDADPTVNASSLGGIVGANYGEVTGCTNHGNIYLRDGNASPVGGITGVNAGIIDRCQNNSSLQGVTTYLGGIAGQSYFQAGYYNNPQITNCVNTGSIIGTNSSEWNYCGGVCGYASRTEMRNCYNIGEPVDMKATYGNLAGQLSDNLVLDNCYYMENGSFGLGRYGNTFMKDDSSLDQGEKRTAAEMQSEDFLAALNASENTFIRGTDYPVPAPLPLSVAIHTEPAGAGLTVMQGDTEIAPQSDGTYLLVPGDYSAVVNAENYASKTEAFTVTFNQDTHKVNIVLDILPADYQAVDEAIGKANALKKEEYKDFTAVESAVNAVDRSKNITQQAEVDAMAKAIEDAISGLKYRDADYTKVDEAIAKAEKLDKSKYKDFTAVESAIKAVVRGKNITEQSEVDAMAKAIEDAVNGLEKKPVSQTTNKTTSKPAASTGKGTPRTGDYSNMHVWVVLLLISGVGAIAVISYVRKKKRV